jgi:CheY-like chemotaxis protein
MEHPQGTEAPLDPVHVRELRELRSGWDGMGERVDDLIRTYVAEWADAFGRLERAVAEGDLRRAAIVAHGLAGSSGACGAQHVAALCRDAELLARANDGAALARLLPRAVAAADEARDALLREFPGAAEAPPARILVADDNAVNRELAEAMLERLGYRADVVEDGVAAVEAAAQADYAAVLMDCQMPRLDGYEATREIRRAEDGRRTPVIALTGAALPGDREKCLAAGMDDHVAKPIQLAELERVLDRWVPADARR